jgi:hypothetical protein
MFRNLGRLGCCLAILILFSGLQAFGQAGLGVAVSGALSGSSTVIAGQTNQAASITFTNGNAVGDAETVSAITFNPSCKTPPAAGVACAPGQGDLGVFSISSTGTGRTGTACAGTVFTFSAPDANGTITITPSFTLGSFVPGQTPQTICVIDFTVNVLKTPTADCDSPPKAGLQTCSGVNASATDNINNSVAFGTGEGQPTFPLTCAAQIDKEISCDGGTTWQDPDFNNTGGALGCIGAVDATNIRVRYRVSNPTSTTANALPITSCTLAESNAGFGAPGLPTFPIAVGATSSFFGPAANTLTCQALRGTTNEPNTATLNCACASPLGNQTAQQVTDQATFECCGVQVDKQVSCNGGPFVDVSFGATPVDDAGNAATRSCTAINGQPIGFRYFARNTGTTAVTCGAGTLLDTQPLVTLPAGGFGTIAAGATTAALVATAPTTCSTALNANEPDTVSLSRPTAPCTCSGTNIGTFNLPTVTDSASILCQAPGAIQASKTCVNTTDGNFNVTVNLANTVAGSNAARCTVADTFFTNATRDVLCATDSVLTPPFTGDTSNPLTLTPSGPYNVANGTPVVPTGAITGLPRSACNTALVTCVDSVSNTAIPVNGNANGIATVLADCTVPAAGCFTRTPGYWGTHPDQAQQVITGAGGSIASCGLALTNAAVPGNLSTTQDVCSVGTDRQHFNTSVSSATGQTSSQQVQLARQCTAAALNLAASANPKNVVHLNCEQSFPGITKTFGDCCGTTATSASICSSGNTAGVIDASECIGLLDAFNNRFDSTDFPSTVTNSAAEPGFCQDASGDRFLNFGPNRHYGSGK